MAGQPGRRLLVALALGIAWLVPAGAQAQEQEKPKKVATTFEELQGRVLLGETVRVIQDDGRSIRGRLLRLTPSDLTVQVEGRETTVEGAKVVEVKARRMGPLWNGALIGAAVPAVTLGILFASLDGDDCNSDCALATIVWTGIGAAIGVGIDALVKGDITVMKAPDASKRSLLVAPLIQGQRRGVQVAIRF